MKMQFISMVINHINKYTIFHFISGVILCHPGCRTYTTYFTNHPSHVYISIESATTDNNQ